MILLEFLREITKFMVYCSVIIWISKNIIANYIRKLAENLKLKPRIVGEIAGCATSVPELLTVTISAFSRLIRGRNI